MSVRNRVSYYKSRIKTYIPCTQYHLDNFLDSLPKFPNSSSIFIAGTYYRPEDFRLEAVNAAGIHVHTFFRATSKINNNYIAQDLKRLFNNLYEVKMHEFIVPFYFQKIKVGTGMSPNVAVLTNDVRDAMELFALGVVLI